MTPLADTVLPEHPLVAVLLWRSMIDFALSYARSGRYRHAARHLASCAEADAVISDYGEHPSHDSYVQGLRQAHGRKSAFWKRCS